MNNVDSEVKLPPNAIAALQTANKIEAIKLTRNAANCELKAAKDAVEKYLALHPDLAASIRERQNRAGGSLLGWVAMLVLVVAAVFYFWPR